MIYSKENQRLKSIFKKISLPGWWVLLLFQNRRKEDLYFCCFFSGVGETEGQLEKVGNSH